MAKQNPNKANQYVPDPRQSLFLSYYLDPKSKTFSNAYQSAKKAGYEEEYSQNITSLMPTWLSESIGDQYLIKKAEENLKEFLEMETKTVKPIGDKVVEINDPQLTKIKQDTTKFVAERLNKQKYSTRSELTGAEGKDIVPTFIVQSTEAKEQLEKLYGGSDSTNN